MSKPNYIRPNNYNSPVGKNFWEGMTDGIFLAQRCLVCGELFFPPRPFCPECLGDKLIWEELSRRGTLHSWTELHYARPEFDTPLLLGLVDLEEGIGRIVARIDDAVVDELHIGQPVEITTFNTGDGFYLYRISPLKT